MSTIFKTASGKWLLQMSKKEAKQVLADGGFKKTAMPTTVTRQQKIQMTKPSQWLFNLKTVKRQEGGAINIVFAPNLYSEKDIEDHDINLNAKEVALLEKCVTRVATEVGGEAYDSDTTDWYILFNAANFSYEDDFALDKEWPLTPQEIQHILDAVPIVKNKLQQMGFVFNKNEGFYSIDPELV